MFVIEHAGLALRRLEFHEHVVMQPNQETATVDVLWRVVKFDMGTVSRVGEFRERTCQKSSSSH